MSCAWHAGVSKGSEFTDRGAEDLEELETGLAKNIGAESVEARSHTYADRPAADSRESRKRESRFQVPVEHLLE